MRGTRRGHQLVLGPTGIIPALAGNTYDLNCCCLFSWDHPRACGEHSEVGRGESSRMGSSPRLRGTHGFRGDHAVALGIIPALAGNTASTRSSVPPSRDHPRACGEHIKVHPCLLRHAGSSPRLRGTPRHAQGRRVRLGIIPALAGNTVRRIQPLVLSGDHPRACGEHIADAIPGASGKGSSPRLRGTHDVVQGLPLVRGIIPALAGNTCRPAIHHHRSWDHPRACGEHRRQCGAFDLTAGSSPRLRGTRHAVGAVAPFAGIIPALAGNTALQTHRLWAGGDHPRACGEH